ncbi:ATP-grasp domain-containing protein [Lelliottia amnigena]|uniref:ATP-grasp domain-containing protein n=1 Tax=Lelliottia amnigena TaxID=61646 RepID=UPI002B221E12|nr:ATP-grasp domain-containing protein [Lelliottia amnigena]MEA9394223.1 ATP-grasp domain-containing protein [Lelliottia amnigena]
MNKLNVLIFPCGSENAGEIFQALRYSLHVNKLIGASSVSDHGEFRFDIYEGNLPNISEEHFQSCLEKLIERHSVDVVFATHDSVAQKLSEFKKAGDWYLINGNAETARIARHKSATYDHFADCDWAPKRYFTAADIQHWPVIVKPDCGQGGNGIERVGDPDALSAVLERTRDAVIVEYLPGEEITVDCFTDRDRELVWVGPRSRERVRAGISMRSRVVPLDAEIEAIVATINQRLVLRGPWFVQLKRDDSGRWKLLEISCRVAGSMVFQRARGVNLPLMALHDFMGRNVTALPNSAITMIDRSIMSRMRSDIAFEQVFVDLDDTLIIDGEAVPMVMAFIYQCRSKSIPVRLITRHEVLPQATLEKAAIAISLFTEVIHLTRGEKKSSYVAPGSLFIDNYFPERLDVSQIANTVVIDTDAVEFFLR